MVAKAWSKGRSTGKAHGRAVLEHRLGFEPKVLKALDGRNQG